MRLAFWGVTSHDVLTLYIVSNWMVLSGLTTREFFHQGSREVGTVPQGSVLSLLFYLTATTFGRCNYFEVNILWTDVFFGWVPLVDHILVLFGWAQSQPSKQSSLRSFGRLGFWEIDINLSLKYIDWWGYLRLNLFSFPERVVGTLSWTLVTGFLRLPIWLPPWGAGYPFIGWDA